MTEEKNKVISNSIHHDDHHEH